MRSTQAAVRNRLAAATADHRRHVEQAEELRRQAREQRAAAVVAALDAGLTLRQCAEITGLDHSRIWQICRSTKQPAGQSRH